METEISSFFDRLPEPKRSNARALRRIILSASSEVGETIKWNQLTFTLGRDNICFIYTFPSVDYINLGFMQATRLSDPRRLFEGTGKGMRHIKIHRMEDIPAAQLKKWVKESLALYRG